MHKGREFFLTGAAARRCRALRATAFVIGMAWAGFAVAGPGQPGPRVDKMPEMPRDIAPRAELARQDVVREEMRAFEEQRRLMQAQQAQQPQQVQQPADAMRRGGHLTADERLELRRQINEVGQDIYVNKRRR